MRGFGKIFEKKKDFLQNINELLENQDIEGLVKVLQNSKREEKEKAIEVLKSSDNIHAAEALRTYEIKEHEKALLLLDEGISLLQQLRCEQALSRFEKALEHDPQEAEIWYWKSLAIIGDFEAELKAIDQALKLNPTHVKALLHKTRLLGPKNYDAMLDCYDKVLEIDPQNVDACTGKARALCGLHRFDEAELSIKRAIELAPNDSSVWFSAGSTFEDAGRIEEAVDAYRRFVELGTREWQAAPDSLSNIALKPMISLAQQAIAKYEKESKR